MSDTKLLQAILDGQKDLKEEIRKNGKGIEENRKRLDNIGLNLAEHSDDTPTIHDFDKLEKRVTKIENHLADN